MHAFKQGYNVILCDSEEATEEERFYIDVLLRKGIDGLILSPVNTDASFHELINNRIPVVQVDRMLSRFRSDFVGINNIKSAETATRYLQKQGYRHIAFIGFEDRIYTMEKRKEGYSKAMRERGFRVRILTLSCREYDMNISIKQWLMQNVEIDALLCGNDNICYGVLSAAQELNLRIPEELGVISFDDSKWFRFMECPITAISQPTGEIGRIAVELLRRRIEGIEDEGYEEVLLDAELKIRQSCRKSG